MLDAFGHDGLQSLEPAGEVHARHPVQQIRVDIRKPTSPGRADCGERVRPRMKPFQEAQGIGPQTLHADAESVHAGGEPAIDLLTGDVARVRFEGDLGVWREPDRVDLIHDTTQLIGREQAGRSAPDEHRVDRPNRKGVWRYLDLPGKHLDVRGDQTLEYRVGIEVAVLAHPGAERYVQIEIVNAFHQSRLSTAINASCGISTLPTRFSRFLPSFCFSSNFRFRVTSPP